MRGRIDGEAFGGEIIARRQVLTGHDAEKKAAAEAAVAEIEAGMLVGLGTGTTAAFAIAAIGRGVKQGLRIACVGTSLATIAAAEAAGIAVRDMAGIATIDLAIDGVDEIDGQFRAIKGGGGAMLREKVVAAAATRMIAIADASKAIDRLGARPVPVEVLPFAEAAVTARIAALGGAPTLRIADGARFLTDQGNHVLDCAFGALTDPAATASALAAIPGVLGHGLFLDEIDALYLGTSEGVVRTGRRVYPNDAPA